MAENVRKPIPYPEAPDYFGVGCAMDYADNFRLGAAGSYAKNERWAKYSISQELDCLVTELQQYIFSVVCHPPGGFEVDDADYIEQVEIFRGWILEYDPPTNSFKQLVASQEEGIDEFIRLRRQYKAE